MHHYAEIRGARGSYALLTDSDSVHTAAVFVHGFLGDASRTWINFFGLLHECPDWNDVDLYFYDYDSFGSSVTGAADDLRPFVRSIIDRTVSFAGVRAKSPHTPTANYENFWLIGHSLGGVVLRALIRREMQDILVDPSSPLLHAQLRLFAPAIRGFRPTRLYAILFQLGGLKHIALSVLRGSKSFNDLQAPSGVLDAIADDTTAFATSHPNVAALRARIVWSADDDVITDLDYRYDVVVGRVPATTHTSVCKPRPDYLIPLEFAARGQI